MKESGKENVFLGDFFRMTKTLNNIFKDNSTENVVSVNRVKKLH